MREPPARGRLQVPRRLQRDLALDPEADRARGVVAYSSGNHAQAVALAAGCSALRAPSSCRRTRRAAKRAATEGYGARVVPYDPATREPRGDRRRASQAEPDATLIPPFDHPHVIAGQGTAARELIEDAGPLDLLLVPCGGGGLLVGLRARRAAARARAAA